MSVCTAVIFCKSVVLVAKMGRMSWRVFKEPRRGVRPDTPPLLRAAQGAPVRQAAVKVDTEVDTGLDRNDAEMASSVSPEPPSALPSAPG